MEMAEYLTYCRLVHMSVPLRSVIKLSIGVSDDLMVVIVTHHVLRPRAEAIRSGHGVGLSKRTDGRSHLSGRGVAYVCHAVWVGRH
jgi:hypothetical protein